MRSQYVPEWITFEIEQALAAISGEHVAKKEATVLRLAQAVSRGESQSSVFRQSGTCSKNVWHGVGKKRGWKDDPAIARALDLATQRARWWVRVKEGRAIQNALDALVDLSEDAVRQIASAVRYGQLLFPREGDIVIKQASVAEVLKASTEVLDRVSELTAAKNLTTVQTLNADQFAALAQKAKTAAADLEAQAGELWNPEREPDGSD
jgi:hypothetical protein